MIPTKFSRLFTVLDQIKYEKNLHKHFRHMQHEEKKAKASEIIHNHMGFSMGAALTPVPGADLLAVSAVQLNMLRQLAKLYNIGFLDALGKNVISALVGTGVARIGASLIKIIPGVGTVIGELTMPVLSGASTYALGKVVAHHFHQGGTLEDLDLGTAKKKYENEMEHAKTVADDLKRQQPAANPTDETLDKLKKMSEMKDAGILTQEEFKQIKERLIAQI